MSLSCPVLSVGATELLVVPSKRIFGRAGQSESVSKWVVVVTVSIVAWAGVRGIQLANDEYITLACFLFLYQREVFELVSFISICD